MKCSEVKRVTPTMDLDDGIPEAAAAVANVAAAADVANAVAAAAANFDNGLDINPNAVQGHAVQLTIF